jgi:hypothetical protein
VPRLKIANPQTAALERATRTFLLSCAGYCVATYVLGLRYERVYKNVHAWIIVCLHSYLHGCMHEFIYVCMHVCMSVCMSVCMFMHVGVYMSAAMYAWIDDTFCTIIVSSCFCVGVCDRHNDNMMLTKRGHFFHIDFGKFFGDAQRFGNIKRDRVPFILTADMAYVINLGDAQTPRFQVRRCKYLYSMPIMNVSMHFIYTSYGHNHKHASYMKDSSLMTGICGSLLPSLQHIASQQPRTSQSDGTSDYIWYPEYAGGF